MPNLRQLLGIDIPIVQAPMAGVQGSALAIAVSNAGGLGSLPCAMLSADAMRKEIAAIVAATDKPYNVNFFCHAPPVASAATVAATNGGCSKSVRSSIAAALRNSRTMKEVKRSAARTNSTIGVTEAQPCLPSTNAASNAPVPVANSSAPNGSRPRGAWDFDS